MSTKAKNTKSTKTQKAVINCNVAELKELAKNDDLITSIINNDDIFVKSLTDSERLKVVIYNEIKKSIDNNTHEAILQVNYDCTKHADSNSYNLIRFVEIAKHQNALTNMYITVKKDDILVKCTVSANKVYQDALASANYDIVKHFKTVKLQDLTNEIKTLYAIFNSTH